MTMDESYFEIVVTAGRAAPSTCSYWHSLTAESHAYGDPPITTSISEAAEMLSCFSVSHFSNPDETTSACEQIEVPSVNYSVIPVSSVPTPCKFAEIIDPANDPICGLMLTNFGSRTNSVSWRMLLFLGTPTSKYKERRPVMFEYGISPS